MSRRLSQREQIKAHLLSGKTITPLQALHQYNCMSLAQRINNLKAEGLVINTTLKVVGNNKRVAEYKLAEMP